MNLESERRGGGGSNEESGRARDGSKEGEIYGQDGGGSGTDGGILVFTTSISPELSLYLEDDYNYEMAVRLAGLRHRAAVNAAKDHGARVRKLVATLFPRMVVNMVRRCGEVFQPVQMSHNNYGKPLVSGLHFNTSSSNDVVCVVVRWDLEIGVDLSHARQNIAATFMDDFHDIFSVEEHTQMMAFPAEQRYVMFNQLWTLKESFTKYLGVGLNVDLNKFWFDMGQGVVGGTEGTDNGVLSASGRVRTDSGQTSTASGGIATDSTDSYHFPFSTPFAPKWSQNIPINTSSLQPLLSPDLAPLVAHNLGCRSCVLLSPNNSELPVIMSIITPEMPVFRPSCFQINFLDALRAQ